jgi:glyoxylase-like metal-dependent hydrolase (beta-lactamase superfamily II)
MAVGALTMTVAALQQPAAPPAPMVIDVDKLKDNLYVMKGGGGNTAVFITADGVTVVDTKLPGWGQPLLDKIRTVTHFDHNSGNVEFPASVEVITHANTKTYMEQANPVYGLQTGPQPNIFKEHGGNGMPKRTFRDKMTVGRGPDQIDLYYFGRAHTGGDAFVVFPALRVMHVGDTMANRNIPIVDKNNGGSTTTPADLRLFSEFIADFVKFTQDAKKAGKSVDDVVNTWKTPAKYTGYGMPNPMFVRSDAQVIFEETK